MSVFISQDHIISGYVLQQTYIIYGLCKPTLKNVLAFTNNVIDSALSLIQGRILQPKETRVIQLNLQHSQMAQLNMGNFAEAIYGSLAPFGWTKMQKLQGIPKMTLELLYRY